MSANNIDGITLHKFVNRVSSNIKSFDKKVIIIDEISMMLEKFYKFFSTLKRLKPEICIIMVGDFLQLKPVGDRIKIVIMKGRQF